MKRKFYLMGHNPNTLEEATQVLKDGANALEPDVHYHPDKLDLFYLYDNHTPDDWDKHSLKNYLVGIKDLLDNDKNINLSLIAYDVKTPYNYYLGRLMKYTNSFLLDYYPDISILNTIGKYSGVSHDDMSFLSSILGILKNNQAVGIDEGTDLARVDSFFKPHKMNYSYSTGSSVFDSVQYKDYIKNAIKLRNKKELLKFVYSWTLNSRKEITTYLDLNVDGAVTDRVNDFIELLNTTKYSSKYELAIRGDNPFA